MTTMTVPSSLKLTRLIKAPSARVFAAWTTPAELLKWLAPARYSIISVSTDLQPGGEYCFRLRSPQQDEIEIHGVYREITPAKELVFTWSGTCCETPPGEETIVTVEFHDRDGGTEVRLMHEFFPDGELRDEHYAGWSELLDNLEKYLGK